MKVCVPEVPHTCLKTLSTTEKKRHILRRRHDAAEEDRMPISI